MLLNEHFGRLGQNRRCVARYEPWTLMLPLITWLLEYLPTHLLVQWAN